MQSSFLHMVFFGLKEPGPESASKLAEGCKTYLSNIPGVLRLDVGFPAGTSRDVVDNAYGVGLVVEFADREAHDVYQDHPDHHRFIEACSSLWSQVRVFDVLTLPDA